MDLNREEVIKQSFDIIKEHFEFKDGWMESRLRTYIDVRCCVYHYLYHHRKFTKSEIARAIGKDHASIINAISNYYNLVGMSDLKEIDARVKMILEEEKVKTYKDLVEEIEILKALINKLEQDLNECNSQAGS